jgi:Uma2 family endonuclease
MGAKTALTVEEYLHTSFPDLDKEYWDGEIVERSLPTDPHSLTQYLILRFFAGLPKSLRLFPRPELRVRLTPTLVLVPDVCVFHPSKPTEPAPGSPPLVVIEILSPDDRPRAVREKFEKYRTWGVPYIWLADPKLRRLQEFAGALKEVPTLRIPELGIELTPADAFDE